MAFRDQTEALRAHIEVLEGELDAARARIEALESDREELERLRARVRELERELGDAARRPPKAAPPPPAGRGGPWWRRRRSLVRLLVAVCLLGGFVLSLASEAGLLGGIDLEGPPTAGMVALADHPRPPPLPADVTGRYPLADLGCAGHVPGDPLLVARVAEPTQVRVWVTSEVDTVLFVRTADGQTLCDDDSGAGTSPMLNVALPAGDHRIWVGTYGAGDHASVRLHLDATGEGAGIAPGAEPTVARLRVEPGTDRRLVGRVDGWIRASSVRRGCSGYLPSAPAATLEVERAGVATLTARAAEDLVLLLRLPDGTFACDDDSAGSLDPRLRLEVQPGLHQVWVGTYHAFASSDFALHVQVQPPGTPPPPPGGR